MLPLYPLKPIVLTIKCDSLGIRQEVSGNVLKLQCDRVVVSTSILPTSPLLDVRYGTICFLSLQHLVPNGNITYVVANAYPLFDL